MDEWQPEAQKFFRPDHLFVRKIIKKFNFDWDSAPNPTAASHSIPPNP